jgi:hypothetical protein
VKRRVLAVLAGFLVIVVLSIGTDQILHATGVYPPWGQNMADSLFVLATAYRILYGILGCWVAARLAPDRPMGHAMALGWIGVLRPSRGVFRRAEKPRARAALVLDRDRGDLPPLRVARGLDPPGPAGIARLRNIERGGSAWNPLWK